MRIVQTAIYFLLCLPFAAHAYDPRLLASMPDAEQDYYDQIFVYTMENINAGEHYDWQSYSSSGSITPDKSFISKSGYACRKFSETFNVGGQTGERKGVGCKRGGEDGWCRLKPDNALTCALEKPEGLFNEGKREVGGTLERDENNFNAYERHYSPR